MAASWFPVELSFARDPRVVRLAKALGCSRREAMGALIDAWSVAYDRMSAELAEDDIDASVDLDHFAASLVAVGLASVTEAALIRLHGVQDRLARIERRREAGSVGGQASAAKRTTAHETPTVAQRLLKHPSTVAQALDQTRREDLPLSHSGEDQAPPGRESKGGAGGASPSKKGKGKPSQRTYDSLDPATRQTVDNVLDRLEKRSGIAYTPVNAHVDLIVARLAEGYSEIDLRGVIGWVASDPEDGGRGWEKDEKFRSYISPKTLFGPKKIEEYIDQSRAWVRRHHPGIATPSSAAQPPRGGQETTGPQSPTGPRKEAARANARGDHQPLFGGLLDE